MKSPILIATLLVSACVEPVPTDDELAATEQAIEGGSLAADWQRYRAAKPRNCTATLIAPRYAVTAQHCVGPGKIEEGGIVRFYDTGPGLIPTGGSLVINIYLPAGVTRGGYAVDAYGNFADLAVLRLDRPHPHTSVPATLAWDYPGPGQQISIVGAGSHNGDENPDRVLRSVTDLTWSEDDEAGWFKTRYHLSNGGDSGGPLYDGRRVLGVLSGEDSGRGLFTSVPDHLHWLLNVIGYVWPHGTVQHGQYRLGQIRESFHASEKECQYACDHSPSKGYNWSSVSSWCTLLSSVTSAQVHQDYRSAVISDR